MFPEGSWSLCRLVVFSSNATVRVSKSGYIMLQYSLANQKPKALQQSIFGAAMVNCFTGARLA